MRLLDKNYMSFDMNKLLFIIPNLINLFILKFKG